MVPSALQISMCTALWHLGQDRCCFVHIVCPAVSLSWPYTNGMLSDLVYSNTICLLAGATALMAAAGKGRLDDVITLLANGAEASAISHDGSSAVEWARRFGHDDIAEYLSQHAQVCGHLLPVHAHASAPVCHN